MDGFGGFRVWGSLASDLRSCRHQEGSRAGRIALSGSWSAVKGFRHIEGVVVSGFRRRGSVDSLSRCWMEPDQEQIQCPSKSGASFLDVWHIAQHAVSS